MNDHIRRHLGPDESLLLLTDTDLRRDGTFGERWLAVTTDRVMMFPDGDRRNGPEEELPLRDIKEVKSVHLVGQMALEVETDGRKMELMRCTNSLAERFGKVAKALSDARRDDKEPRFEALEDEEERRCKECGRLLPERGSFCPACLKRHKVAARFWKYLAPHKGKALLVSATILLGTGAALVPPYLVKVLVDDVLGGTGGKGLLLVIVMGLVALHAVSMLLGVVRGRLAAWLSSRIMHDVRFDLYQAIQGLTLRRYDKTQVGSLMARLTGDTTMLNDAFIFVGFWALPSVLQLAGICAILLTMSPMLGFLVLVPAPGVVALTWWFFKRLRGYYFLWWQRRSKMSALANDCISGMRVVKAFSQEAQEIGKFEDRSRAFFLAWAKADGMWATAMPVITFVTTLGTFFVWYFGGLRVLSGSGGLTLGTLMAFIAYLGMFYGPLQMLTRLTDFLNRAMTAAQRLFEIMDTDQEVYDDPDAEPMDEVRGGFEFREAHFAYLPDKPVLKGVSVSVNPGEMIGLVGKSGVGKTTMINLICRFYDVEDGAILLDGRDLRQIRLRDLRRHIAIVPQESYLFHGTIYENIAYARPDATKKDVIQAAIAANAHGFIMRQPDGYDTRVGERGAQLSGGERQRIAIARAILHDPKILILDEATSSVDTETEELIQEALGRLVKGRTTFAIAHRLSTLRNSDRLLVIDEGKVAEFGTHEELLGKKGVYQNLVEMQSKLSAATAVGG
ncbi:MAG: ABC transporter ATP-binding protein [Candidatus Hydrogenedentes bacterium]|nr:ABC transporter ATP-binding protein [Candidatus Hydrogenedentota bacterium]